MTDAMFDWMEKDEALHPLHLGSALTDFNTVLGIYVSALQRRPVSLPVEAPDGLIHQLRDALSGE